MKPEPKLMVTNEKQKWNEELKFKKKTFKYCRFFFS